MTLRRTPLKLVPPADHSKEAGYREWKALTWGECAVCGEGPQRLERHHVIAEQVVRREHGNPYDLRNALSLGAHCHCHSLHHQAAAKLPASCIPAEAIEFAIELLGAGASDLYFDRYYSAR